jgi:hypothetical protein
LPWRALAQAHATKFPRDRLRADGRYCGERMQTPPQIEFQRLKPTRAMREAIGKPILR